MQNKRFQVFVSSTYNDLREEREKVLNALNRDGHIASGMEGFPATDDEQLEYIQRIIDESDYYIVVVKGRYGSLSSDGKSYTEREFDYAVSKGIPALAFIYNDRKSLSVRDTDDDPEKHKKLMDFTNRLENSRIVKYWGNAEELCREVKDTINSIIRRKPGIGWVRGDQALDSITLAKIETLRSENEELKAARQIGDKASETDRCIEGLKNEAMQVECDITISSYEDSGFRRKTVRVQIVQRSGIQILLAIAEYLYSQHPPAYIFEEIAKICKGEVIIAHGEALEFSDKSKQRLRAELESRGLIDVVAVNTVLHWRATSLARSVISRLRLTEAGPLS